MGKPKSKLKDLFEVLMYIDNNPYSKEIKILKVWGENLTEMIEPETAFSLIDKMKNKYPSTCDTYQLLVQLSDIWEQIPWHIKLKIVAICFFAQKLKQNIFITFALLAIFSEIQSIFKPLH